MIPAHSDLDFLTARYAVARNKYKPADIKVLIIAEAPPCDLDRYFYFEEVSRQDSLFLEIMGVLYPELKAQYLASKRDPMLKAELLEHFQADGCWLMDLSEVPHEVSGTHPEDSLPSLLARLKKVTRPETSIILIKANVYDCCYEALKEAGYNVSAERIPFPGSGQQSVFREKFKKALHIIGL
jgi:hypothetical protein